jgi:hypothetical protein
MTRTSLTRLTLVSLASAAIFVPTALAGGEPKNDAPFTRPATVRSEQAAAHPTIRQEPATRGEAKNQLPFTRPATVVIAKSSDTGFDWTAGGLGALAGFGIALTGAGAVLAARKSPQTA